MTPKFLLRKALGLAKVSWKKRSSRYGRFEKLLVLLDADTTGIAGGAQEGTRKSLGKTGETIRILLKMANSLADLSESSQSPEGTSASPNSSSSERRTSEPEEEPSKKRKKSREVARKRVWIEEAKASSLGESSYSSGGLGDDEFGIPESVHELYHQYTLQAALEGLLLDWLVDPSVELPSILTLPGEEEVHFAAGQMDAEAPPSLEDLSGCSPRSRTGAAPGSRPNLKLIDQQHSCWGGYSCVLARSCTNRGDREARIWVAFGMKGNRLLF
ncbi:hypothetical protein ACSSS7_003132 [Eimeria intestinalis]